MGTTRSLEFAVVLCIRVSLAFRAQFCAKNEASERDAVAVAGFFRANGEISRTRAGSF